MRSGHGSAIGPALFSFLMNATNGNCPDLNSAPRAGEFSEGKLSDLFIWQLADSAFPTGAFAHSGGLEAACQHRALSNGADLAAFLEAQLIKIVHGTLPFVYAAFDIGKLFLDIDRLCDAFLSNHVANRASRTQGQAFVSTAERAFSSPTLREFRIEISEARLPGHAAPVFGRVARLLGLGSFATARLFVFTQLRLWVSAAVRLNTVGPIEAQKIQHQFIPRAEWAAAQFGMIALDDIAQTAPLLDLWQGTQNRLYSRLFQS